MSRTLDRLKDPAYTGQNRCLPCTAVNVAIALVLGAAVSTLWVPAGVATLLVSALAIYVRGYLVPGTPTLTKRYLPRPVLDVFHGVPREPAPAPASEVDVGGRLLAAGLLRDGGDDLHLTDEARDAWRSRVTAVRDRERDVGPDDVAAVLGDAPGLELEPAGSAWVATTDAGLVGRWESRAALLADVTGADLLAERLPEWNRMESAARAELLGGLRLFLERCPTCDAAVTFGTETVESCCSEREVVAVTCEGCGARILESEAP